MDLKDLMKTVAQTDAIYREVRLQENIFRLASLQRESVFDQIVKNIELPSFVTKGLNDLLYADSLTSLTKHFSALEDRASAINKLNILGAATAPTVLSAVLEPPGMKSHFLASHCGVSIEEMFKSDTAIDKLISAGTAASVFSPTKAELFNVAASISTPWIDAVNPLRSIEGMAGLATLGKAVSLSPFDEKATNAISGLIGDWGKLSSVAAAIPQDWMDRRDFYFAHGFDNRLTALPEPAFTQSLYNTELLRPDLFSPVFPRSSYDYTKAIFPAPAEQFEEEESEEDAIKRRMLEAYDLLFNLETHIREFIVEVMSRKYGARWTKQRITEGMRRQWADKKEIAMSKGEEDLPLIWYADFSDYVQIIVRKDNWKDIFEALFFNAIDVQASFQRLQPLRICTMHSRPISREDLLLITVESHRILRAIGKIQGSA